jgi:nitrite reductase/ring-hydroxylating ferredoxin subunit
MFHGVHRADIPENGMLTLQHDGRRYVLADVEGELLAFAVSGPAANHLERVVVAEGRLRCPLHGWPIDPAAGRCGAAEFCRFDPLEIAVDGFEVRVDLAGS